MSVTSVLTVFPTPYGAASGNTSRSAKYAGLADQLQGDAAARAKGAVTTGPDAAEAGETDSADVSQFQGAFAEALRADGTTARGSTSGASGSGGGQSSAGIALYKRVSLIGNNESSPSALLKSWNSIVHGVQDGRDAGAAALQAHLQNGASEFGQSILDVTA